MSIGRESTELPPAQALPAAPDDAGRRLTLLDERLPGQSVIAELLAVVAGERPRSRLGRLFGADPLSPDSRPWYQGAEGEIAVGKLLARLGPGWMVLHAVPVGAKDSDIDHVLIGASGVFTINTKHHEGKSVWVAGGTLMVSGQKQNHIRNSVHEAARAGKLLSAATGLDVPVAGVIVLVGTRKVDIKKAAAGATVLTSAQLLRWLGKRPPVLAGDAVAQIAAAANRPETWHREPRDAGSPAQLQDGFGRVQKSVRAARRRKSAWGFGGMAAMAAGTLAAAPSLAPELIDAAVQLLVP